ncbi:MAG: Rne/Rng family ribonuclease [Elusimicrobia bacterium]|nr:Rne/Rng family ribonuclease [Elusimicrobiota bacterium]
MSNENEQIQTPQTTEPYGEEASLPPVVEKGPPAEAPVRPEPIRVHDDSTPGPASAPAREDLYPRAGGPVEADRDIPQAADEPREEDDGGDSPSVPAAAPIPVSAPSPLPPAESGMPAVPGHPGHEFREGGRRRRRRRRGGRGSERGQNGQNPPKTGGQAPAPERPSHERRESQQGGGRERHGQERREGRHDGGRGRAESRGSDRHHDDRRDERGGRGQERTNAGKGSRAPVKREVLANTSFEETRIAILENGRLSELHWERKSSQNIVGNVYKGTVENVLPGISSAFVNIGFEKNAYLYISDVLGDKNAPIDQTLKKGQTVMVQVAKEAISTKGPKVTMDVSLPGRYLVFTPYQEYVGISKHIAEPEERQRLERVVDKLVKTHLGGKGVVVRTEAEGATEEELEREVKYLQNLWSTVQKKYAEQPAPAILHQDLGLAMQIARDILSDQVYVYLLDGKESQKQVVDFVEGFAPELKDRIKLYEGKTPIFKAFNIEKQIETIRETKVSLPNGGSIVIQEAESLCAIDVNTGRFTGSKSQEETVTQTNIEAAMLVAQQIRLRNIGGIIVVDFIDMRKASNRAKVMEAFAEACKADRAKIRILPITRLGLIELTRERKRMSTAALLTAECPQCRASGRVLSAETLRIKIQREIFEITGGRPGGSIRVSLHPSVADSFRSQQAVIEKNVQRAVRIQSDPNLMWEDYHIVLE